MQQPEITQLQNCRTCGEKTLKTFLHLGPMPIPNGFLKEEQLYQGESYFPLDVAYCNNCGLMTLAHVVRADIMFRNYVYIPGTSKTMVDHFREMAQQITERFNLGKSSLVIDIGSNDGTLLKEFKALGTKVLGIDPAENIAEEATKQGIETMAEFFGEEIAKNVAKKKGQADVITGTNVIAHIDNLVDVMKGVSTLLKNDGVFIGEFPYLVDLIEHGEFDTIYHEHLSYFSIRSLQALAERTNFEIMDAIRTNVHGGSIQVFFKKKGKSTEPFTNELIILEKAKRLDTITPFEDFSRRTYLKRDELNQVLRELKAKGKRIVGYGAAAKGNVLTNFFRIGPDLIDYIVDSIPYKQGLYTPGLHIPIYPETKLLEDMPDYALIFAWNFADEIVQKNAEYRKSGGKFITTIPTIKILY